MAVSMMRCLEVAAGLLAAGRPAETFRPTYIGLAVLAVLLVLALIKAYRVWEELNDVEETASPADVLKSLERAHFAGDLSDEEFERVRARLTLSEPDGGTTPASASPAPAPEHPLSASERPDPAGAPPPSEVGDGASAVREET